MSKSNVSSRPLKSPILALAVVVFFAIVSPVLQGCGGGCTGMTGPAHCVSKGDPSTSYLSSSVSADMCPEGWRCVALTDTDPRNAPLLRTCQASTGGGATSPIGNLPGGNRSIPLASGSVVGRDPRLVVGAPGVVPQPAPQPAPIAAPLPPPVGSCLRECSTPAGSVKCASFALTSAQTSVAAQIAKVVIEERRPQIETAYLMRLFRVASDPCRRGPVVQNGARMTNSGSACMVSTSLPAMRATAQIELPVSVGATIQVSGGNNIFRFAQAGQRPSLRLMDSTHPTSYHRDDARLGGAILQLEADRTRLFVRTTSACIWAVYAGSPAN